jgi:predicted small secreted protein
MLVPLAEESFVITRIAPLFMTVSLAGSLLAGCGTMPGAGPSALVTVGGKSVVKLGFGAEGGTQPSLIKRSNGEWLMVYVGTNVADRHLYWTRSTDGIRWSAPNAIESAAYSDQAPALVEDAQGVVHCFFASNRGGETFNLFHAAFDGVWTDSTEIAGFAGVQDLAATYADGRFLLAAEVMAEGLFAATSADGATFAERELLADAGFEPAVTFLPTGAALVAYTRANQLITRTGKPGADWAAEQVVASTSSRLRGPALAWMGDHGKLIYTERAAAGMTYSLREKRFGADLKFAEGANLASTGGDANSPAIAADHNGKIGLAWGMKQSSSQQGIAFTLDGWK